jgi:hypothetical protein
MALAIGPMPIWPGRNRRELGRMADWGPLGGESRSREILIVARPIGPQSAAQEILPKYCLNRG